MKKTVLFVLFVLLLSVSSVFAQDAATTVNLTPTGYINYVSFGEGLEDTYANIFAYFSDDEDVTCETANRDNDFTQLTCEVLIPQEEGDETDYYNFFYTDEDKLIATYVDCVPQIDQDGLYDSLVQVFSEAYDFNSITPVENDVISNFIESEISAGHNETQSVSIGSDGTFYYAIGGSDNTEKYYPWVFMAIFDGEYIDSL